METTKRFVHVRRDEARTPASTTRFDKPAGGKRKYKGGGGGVKSNDDTRFSPLFHHCIECGRNLSKVRGHCCFQHYGTPYAKAPLLLALICSHAFGTPVFSGALAVPMSFAVPRVRNW